MFSCFSSVFMRMHSGGFQPACFCNASDALVICAVRGFEFNGTHYLMFGTWFSFPTLSNIVLYFWLPFSCEEASWLSLLVFCNEKTEKNGGIAYQENIFQSNMDLNCFGMFNIYLD